MDRLNVVIFLFIFLLVGCGSFSEKARMEDFSEMSKAYQDALEAADYKTAYLYLNPATIDETMDISKYKIIKVVDYEASNIRVSEDHKEINMNVEIGYYLLNGPILRTIIDKQLWKYDEDKKGWQLQTGFPDF